MHRLPPYSGRDAFTHFVCRDARAEHVSLIATREGSGLKGGRRMSAMGRSHADTLVCKMCGETFSSKASIFVHLSEGHDEDDVLGWWTQSFTSRLKSPRN